MLKAVNFTLLAVLGIVLDIVLVASSVYALATAVRLLIQGYSPLSYPLLNLAIAVGCAAGGYVMLRLTRLCAQIGYEASKQ